MVSGNLYCDTYAVLVLLENIVLIKYKMQELLTHSEMSTQEGISLQKGMNFKPANKDYSIFLMSVSDNSPYNDGFDSDGKELTYEGHDIYKREQIDSKKFDQPMFTKTGKLSDNGKFFRAAEDYKFGRSVKPHKIKVYEKITNNVWADKGFFYLVDVIFEFSEQEHRKVFVFKLVPIELHIKDHKLQEELEFSRRIPTSVKRIVWERDKGVCRECSSNKNLHFDHIIPYSKGGTSTNPENIQLLCQKHNLSKSDKII
jgi:hypothetical protein